MYRLALEALDSLFVELKGRGYTIVGPTLRDGAIVYDEIETTAQLPIGWSDEQAPARYQLSNRNDGAWFGYTVGPHAWKRFLYPPRVKLFSAQLKGKGYSLIRNKDDTPGEPESSAPLPSYHSNTVLPKYAFIGVRSCELHAIEIQDRVFTTEPFIDSTYKKLREQALFVAVNCTRAGGTCFCSSMKTGPQCTKGFDLALTEVLTNNEHFFLLDGGSDLGEILIHNVPHRPAEENELKTAHKLVDQTAKQMGRTLNATDVPQLLRENLDHPRWNDVATRCMMCTNCTLVCPTCFCSSVEDVTDLTGEHADRWRRWDSCFTMDFAKVVGGNFRPSPKARYRQWLTHKFSSWVDQFGTSGCVGCGRCITWCPAGIDVTQEIEAIRSVQSSEVKQKKGP